MGTDEETIKVIDRRRFYLDEDGDVHEREPEEERVLVGREKPMLHEDPEERIASREAIDDIATRKESWWRRLRSKLRYNHEK